MTRLTKVIWSRGVALVVEELGEGSFGGGSVEADEGADEQAEAAGALGGSGEGGGVADAGGDEHSLELVHVGGGDRLAASDFGDDVVGQVLVEEVLGLLLELVELGAGDRAAGAGELHHSAFAELVGEVGVEDGLVGALDELHEVAEPLAGVFEHGVGGVRPTTRRFGCRRSAPSAG